MALRTAGIENLLFYGRVNFELIADLLDDG